ncbi:MAG TPA: hypothetical protein VGV93_13580, partial [Acidimicrobiales bacterium]|nr:hypothetical protein [Acidimicrobiales bacterium]
MSTPALHLVPTGDLQPRTNGDTGWREWLVAHVDSGWRSGEWDQDFWRFTGDLDSPRTVAWRCRTPSCPAVTRRHHGRCDTCRRAQARAGLCDEDFDREPTRGPFYPLVKDICSVPSCASELHVKGVCRRHYRAWKKERVHGRPFEHFVAHAEPFARLEPCLVAGCLRERHSGRGLCKFHNDRFRRQHHVGLVSESEVVAWANGQAPRLGPHQFSLATLAEMVRLELLYCLQRRDESPPPLDPRQVRIVVARLAGAASVRDLDLEAVCASGGMQYNATTKGLVRDLGRHLERAWNLYIEADPYEGDCWEVASCDLQPNGSRRYLATEGVIDFRPINQAWLREVAKRWAQDVRPYLHTLRQAIKACAVASRALTAAGRSDPSELNAGDFTRVVDA